MKTVQEVAKEFHVSTRTVRNWIDRGDLKSYRFGKIFRIDEEEVERFKEAGK